MRLQQLDFLRGIAILLVLFFHLKFIHYFNVVGWMGVDLFFVLSGYLISTLIFKELQTFGNFKPKLFLIRRGFKLYPCFYLFLLITIIIRLLYQQNVSIKYIIFEATFTRNFFGGFWVHTWSLCVEEHFYILLSMILYFIPFTNLQETRKVNKFIVSILALCLLLRISSYFIEFAYGESYFFNSWARRVQTFYCIDALLFGVFISYNFHFNLDQFMDIFKTVKKYFLLPALLSIVILPYFLRSPLSDCFLKSIIYISFGIILVCFVADDKLFKKLQTWLSPFFIKLISYIGVFSYPIYLIHVLIREYIIQYIPSSDYRIVFICYLILSILSGIALYYLVEKSFLTIREKTFPKRGELAYPNTN